MKKIGIGIALLLVIGWGVRTLFIVPPIANTPPRSGPIVAFGDSLTSGVGAETGKTDPDQLGEMLGQPVINRGVPGETCADALRRIDEVIADKPAVVLVLLGGNDLLQRHTSEQAFGPLEQIVQRCLSEGAMVTLIGVERPSLLANDYGRKYKSLARKTGCLYVPNILDGIMGKGELMSDQIHPNTEGYKQVGERVAKALRPYLKGSAAGSVASSLPRRSLSQQGE